MPEKDPTTWTATTWVLALGMAFGGGVVNWYAKVTRGHTRAAAVHGHAISDVNGLQAALDSKADASALGDISAALAAINGA